LNGFVLNAWSLLLLWAVLVSVGHADSALVEGRAVINHAGKTRTAGNENVVVWLTPLDTEPQHSVTRPHYQMLQKGKKFFPHVLAVPVGSEVEFPNHDPYFHNVFSLYKGERFDLGLYEAGMSRNVRFDRPGVSFVFCNIHPGMIAYVIALGTPYFAVSDTRGTISIPSVPPGRYRVGVWYEHAPSSELNALSREITVGPSAASLGILRIQETDARDPAHENKRGEPYDPELREPY
jgi:plastocyanin